MKSLIRSLTVTFVMGLAAFTIMSTGVANAANRAQIDREVDVALQQLYASSPAAKLLAGEAMDTAAAAPGPDDEDALRELDEFGRVCLRGKAHP